MGDIILNEVLVETANLWFDCNFATKYLMNWNKNVFFTSTFKASENQNLHKPGNILLKLSHSTVVYFNQRTGADTQKLFESWGKCDFLNKDILLHTFEAKLRIMTFSP